MRGLRAFFCLFASMNGLLRRIRDECGRVESRTAFKRKLGRLENGT